MDSFIILAILFGVYIVGSLIVLSKLAKLAFQREVLKKSENLEDFFRHAEPIKPTKVIDDEEEQVAPREVPVTDNDLLTLQLPK